MGSSMTVVIGPYAEAKNAKDITTIKIKRECPNHKSNRSSNDKFCPQCGETIISVEIPETTKYKVSKFLWRNQQFEDRLYSPDYDLDNVLLPNNYPPNKLKLKYEGFDSVDLSNIDNIKNEQIEWFNKEYSDIFSFLKESGFDLEIKWGVVTYWS